MSPPKPIARRVSGTARVAMPLHQPTPDLQSLPGSHRNSNVSRLEQSAERLSQASSDLAEEIRKMIEVEKEKDRSRNSSLQSSHTDDARAKPQAAGKEGIVRSPSGSYAHSHSIVDVNNTARWGGYSPGGFVTSPVGSVHLHRATSGSRSSRLGQMVEPMQEGRPLDSPLAPSSESLFSQEQQMSRRASQSSFARRYDLIAAQVEESLSALPATSPVPEDDAEHVAEPHVLDTRPSVDTLHDFQNVFKDFDGVHFSPDTEEYVEVDEKGNEVRRVSARTSSGSLLDAASLLKSPPAPQRISYAAPPPGAGMIYYPAPVPRVLNLPKRLSQMPVPSMQAQRRSQMLSEMSPQNRNSAPWLSQSNVSDTARTHQSGSEANQRRSVMNPRVSMAHLGNMPAQMRASMFFEHQPIAQDVDIKSESAVATLDSILAASATAPVSVFTDHPYAGDVRKSVYAPEFKHGPKRSSTTLAVLTEAEKKPNKRRSSSMGRLFRKNSNDPDLELKRPSSRGSTVMLGSENGQALAKRRSQLSLGDELDRTSRMVRTPGGEISEPDMSGLVAHAANAELAGERAADQARPSTAIAHDILVNSNNQIEDDFRNEDMQEDVEESEPIYAAPTTLLAELQVRKAQQKSRNRTAATAYPNGMHSTLLELDAVEEINRRNRKNKRVALAWEDPNVQAQEDEMRGDDDDVPLGMLFPPKDGRKTHKLGDGRDWQRPMGLMEKRELEDSEPLSSRRNRLHGLPPSRTTLPLQSTIQLVEPTEDDAEPEGEVGETLGQRVRRLKTKDALDSTISDFAPKNGERPVSTFTDDILSQFGGLDVKDPELKPASKPASGQPEEEETLGQRRARLQREREASGDATSPPDRPALRSANSLANLLAAHPIGTRAATAGGPDHKSPAHGSLLHLNAQAQSKHKQALHDTNLRSAHTMLDSPLIDDRRPRPSARPASSAGLLGAQSGAPVAGGFANGAYNNGSGGAAGFGGGVANFVPAFAPAPAPMYGVSGTNTYFASPTAGVYAAPQFAQYQATTPAQASQTVNPMAYSALNGGRMSVMMVPSANAGYGSYGVMGMPGVNYGMTAAATAGGAGIGAGLDLSGQAAVMDNQQRAAIDRWRMGIAP